MLPSALTVSLNGTARLWPLDTLPLARERRPRTLINDERQCFRRSGRRAA